MAPTHRPPSTHDGDENKDDVERIDRYEGTEETVGGIDAMLANLQRVKTASTQAVSVLLLALVAATGRAAAAHDALPCEVPPDLVPLFEVLDTIAQVAFLGGVGLATLGFVVGGVYIVLPGEEYTRRGKDVAKHVLLGTILLLSANMIVSFLVSQFGVTICT